MGVFCAWVKLLTDLQILSCELRKNAGEGGLDLDVCPGIPEFLVTPLMQWFRTQESAVQPVKLETDRNSISGYGVSAET